LGGAGVNADTELFSKQYSTGNTAWSQYTSLGESPITALGNNIRFSYESISAAGNNPTFGNFIDAANFGVGVRTPPNAAVPEPITATLGLMGLGVLGMATRRRV